MVALLVVVTFPSGPIPTHTSVSGACSWKCGCGGTAWARANPGPC